MNSKIRWALLGVAALISACGGGGGGAETLEASSSKVTGRVVKGPVAQAQVTAVAVSPYTAAPVSEEISLGETGVDGGFSGDLSQLPLDRPVLIRSFGGSFIDESDPDSDGTGRRQIQVDSESGLFVYRPPGVENVSLTLLTDAMSVRALEIAQQQQISVANAFDAVREQAVSIFGFDPLTTRAVDPISPGDASNDERQYALIIGSLAVVANEVSVRLGRGQMDAEIISAVLDDLSDGAVDGRRGDSPISIGGEPMPDIDWQAAIQRFRNDNDGAYKNVAPPQPNESDWAEVPPPSNTAPTIVPLDTPIFISQGASITIDTALLQASDAETDTTNLKFVLINPPELGQVSFGEVALEPEHDPVDFLVYTNLEAGAQGLTDNVTFAVVDEDGGAAFANVSVQINQLPEPEDDATDIDEDGALTLGVLGNDSDPDGQALEIVGLTPVSQEGSQLTVAGPGQVQILPPQNFFGEISFNYTVSDGFDEADANVQITVNPVNDPPVATDDFITTDEDVAITISPLLNDTDVDDGDTLSIVANTLTAQNGSASLNGTEVTFTPAPDFNGDATLTYEVTDGSATDTGVVTVTVNPLNDAPAVQGGIANQNATEEQPFTFSFSDTAFSDVDGDTLSYTATEVDSMGLPQWLTFNAGARTFSGTPDDLDLPSADIQVTADDGNGGSASTIFTISIAPVNDAPEVQDGMANQSATEEQPFTFTFAETAFSDVEGDTLAYTATELDNGGLPQWLTFNPSTRTFTGTPDDADLTQDPIAIQVTAADGNGGEASTSFTITIAAVNDAPIVQDGIASQNATEEQPFTFAFSDTAFSDVDGDTLSYTATEVDSMGLPQWLTFNAGARTFSGTPDDPDLPSADIQVTADDGNGGSASTVFNISIVPVNDNPVAQNDSVTTDEDTQVTIDVLANDSDVDGDLLTIHGDTLSAADGSVSIIDDELLFTPNVNFNGVTTINYEAADGNGGFAAATVSVTVNPVNDDPEPTNDSASTAEDTAATIDVLANDTDPENDALSVIAASMGAEDEANGGVVVEADNTLTFTPALNFNGEVLIDYTVSDGNGGTALAAVNVTITAVNDAPTIDNQVSQLATDEDTPITLGISDFATTDVESDNLSLVLLPGADYSFSGSDVLPNSNFNGLLDVNVVADDGVDQSAPFVASVSVSPVLDPAIAVSTNGQDSLFCGAFANPCLTPNQGISVAAAESIAHNNAPVSVLLATGNYDIAVEADRLLMQPNVSVLGGYNDQDYQQQPSTNPSDTVVFASYAQSTTATLSCGAGMLSTDVVMGVELRGSTNGTDTLAVLISDDCQASFSGNIILGGAGSNSSVALFGNGLAAANPVFTQNDIDGGSSAANASAVRWLMGSLVLAENRIQGGSSSNGSVTALRLGSAASDVLVLENNLISGGSSINGDTVAIAVDASASGSVVNNTIFGGQSGATASAVRYLDGADANSLIRFTNNIFQSDSDQAGDSFCIEESAATSGQPEALTNNLFDSCVMYFDGTAAINDPFALESFGGGAQPSINVLGVYQDAVLFVDELGPDLNKAQLFDNDWGLVPQSSCASTHGGVSNSTDPIIPVADRLGVNRKAEFSGRCAFVELLEGEVVDGISLGAREIDLVARYVDEGGDDGSDCTDSGAPCLTINRAMQVAQAGDEIRVAVGSYSLSAGPLETVSGRLTKPISLVGGYSSTFSNKPFCDEFSCDTQVSLKADAVEGANSNTVLLCDGTGGGMTVDNTLIAGLSIDATDTLDADNETQGISLVNACNATVTANVVSGGNGGNDGTQNSVGVLVDGASGTGVVPRLLGNFIDAGQGTLASAIGVKVTDNNLAKSTSNNIVIAGNEISGNTAFGSGSAQSFGLLLGEGSVSSTGTAELLGNTIHGGVATTSIGLHINGFGEVNVASNRVYGGVSVNTSIGVAAAALGKLVLNNNQVHGGNATDNAGAVESVRLGAYSNTSVVQLRNNTLFSGVSDGSQRALVFSNASGGGGDFSELFVDNNIIFVPSGFPSQEQPKHCIAEDFSVVPTGLRNNALHQCDGDSGGEDYVEAAGPVAVNDANNNASGNLSSNFYFNPGFIDEDGTDNNPASDEYAWELDDNPQTGVACEVALGGLDGDNSDGDGQNFGYDSDFDGFFPRTDDNNGTGWSMGAFEQDSCASGSGA